MKSNTPIPKEQYKHYKGGIYEIITLAKCSEYPDNIKVIYKDVALETIWCRPLTEWLEDVEYECWKTFNTLTAPRFIKI